MARIRSVCFVLSLQIYNEYPFSWYSWKEAAAKSKFLWKIGCAVTSKDTVASAVPVGLLPNSRRRKSSAWTINSLPSISFPSSVMPPFSSASCTAIACGVNASSCTLCIRSRNHRKSRMASTASLGMKSRKEVDAIPVTARSGTMTILSFFSRESCESTSNVRMLSTSSPKKSIR